MGRHGKTLRDEAASRPSGEKASAVLNSSPPWPRSHTLPGASQIAHVAGELAELLDPAPVQRFGRVLQLLLRLAVGPVDPAQMQLGIDHQAGLRGPCDQVLDLLGETGQRRRGRAGGAWTSATGSGRDTGTTGSSWACDGGAACGPRATNRRSSLSPGAASTCYGHSFAINAPSRSSHPKPAHAAA